MKNKNTTVRNKKKKGYSPSEQKMLTEVVKSVKRHTSRISTMTIDELWAYLSGDVLEAARDDGDVRYVKMLREDLLAKNELSNEVQAYLLFLEGLALQAIGHRQEAQDAYAAALELDPSIQREIEWHGFEDFEDEED